MPIPTLIIAIADYRTDATRHLRELGNELDAIQAALQPAVKAGICKVVTLAEATPKKIVAAFELAEGPVVGFHFAGHNGGYGLLLGDQENASAEGLAHFLGKQADLAFVFLNACATYQHVDQLHQAGVPAVIATSQAIYDKIALDVAKQFYSRLAKGTSLQLAYDLQQAPYDLEGGEQRGLALDSVSEEGFQKYPWRLAYRPGAAEKLAHWSLARAAGDPLFGLPSLDDRFDLPLTPFRYLARYEREQARVFFGRARETRQLYDQLTQPHLDPILLFYGLSGVGKSSLLAAGLLPRLEDKFEVVYHRREADSGLVGGLAQCLTVAPTDDLHAGWLAREAKSGRPLYVILDQVEECFTRQTSEPDELARLCQAMQQIFGDAQQRPQGKLILAYRKEYHPDISDLVQAQLLPYSHLFLQRLDEEGILDAVTGLTRDSVLKKKYNLTIEDDLAPVIASDLLRDPGGSVAPMLQVLLSKMWDRATTKDGAPHFSEADYLHIKREGLLLDDFLDKEMQAVYTDYPAAGKSGLALDLLYFLTTDRGTADQQAEATILARYINDKKTIRALLAAFADHYLLLKVGNDSDPQWRLAHDTLAPLVRARYQQSNQPGQLAQRILQNVQEPISTDNLLSTNQATLAERGRTGMRTWTTVEEELVQKSLAAAARQRRTRRLLLGGLAAAGIILLILFYGLYRAAAKENRLLRATQLVREADALAQLDPTRAYALYKASLELRPDSVVDTKLHDIAAYSPFYEVLWADTTLPINAAAFSPDGQQLVISQSDGGLHIKVSRLQQTDNGWKLADTLIGASLTVNPLLITNDGAVIGGARNHRIYYWNRLGHFDDSYGLLDDIRAIALHPAAQQLALGYTGGLLLLDLEKNRRDSMLLPQPVSAVQFSADGKFLITGATNGLLTIYSWPDRVPLARVALDSLLATYQIKSDPGINYIQSAADGQYISISTVGGYSQQLMWQAGKLVPIRGQDGGTTQAASILLMNATADVWLHTTNDNAIWLEKPGGSTFLKGHRDIILALHRLPDGQVLSLAADGQLLRWSVPADEMEVLYVPPAFTNLSGIAMSATGNMLLAGGSDARVVRYDLATGQAMPSYERHEDRVKVIAAQNDRILSGDRSGQLDMWQATTGETIQTNRDVHQEAITAVAATANHWATADASGKIVLWDVALQQAEIIQEQGSPAGALLFSSDKGDLLWCNATDGVHRYALQNKKMQIFHPVDDIVIALVEGTTSKDIWGLGQAGTLYRWAAEGRLLASYAWRDGAGTTGLAISATGVLAVTTEYGLAYYSADGQRQHIQFPGIAMPAIVFSADGRYLYATRVIETGQSELVRFRVPF